MRSELVALMFSACAVSLDDPPETATSDDTPTIAACTPFDDVTGDIRSIEVAGTLYLVIEGEPFVVADRADDGCFIAAPSEPLGAATPGITALFASGGELYAFVRTYEGLTPVGTTVAPFDPESGRFVPSEGYLFAADGRPSYGDAALVADGFVYAYGVAPAGFFQEDTFVARAPLERVADPTAWTYYSDGDVFVPDPDDAWPIFSGGGGLALTVRDDRVRVAYHAPLGDTILERSGLGPTGPWSPASAVTRCDLPDDAFCGTLAFHDALASDDALVLTYTVASFDDIADRRTRAVYLPLD